MPGERPARPATLLLRGIRFCDNPHGGGKWPSRENHWEPLWGVFIYRFASAIILSAVVSDPPERTIENPFEAGL